MDTDILIVGAGNGGMGAAAYAAAHGLNFRVIEQNGNVQDTRHWVGAVDGFGAQAQGIKMDRAKLLSEISRYASGKCDQRVVKTWINESGEMIEFIRLNAAEAAKAVKLAAQGKAEQTAAFLQLEQLKEELAARAQIMQAHTRRGTHLLGKGRMLRAYPS